MEERKMTYVRYTSWKRFFLLTVVAVIGLLPATTWACAVCWGADDALARGLNVSVLFLMSMPFVIGASIIGVVVVAQRRAQGYQWYDIVTQGLPGRRRRMHRE
jgi:hypothetical protein